jgi:hypothetical protein
LAASFAILNYRRDVACWHIASFRCVANFGRYWRHSGHAEPVLANLKN